MDEQSKLKLSRLRARFDRLEEEVKKERQKTDSEALDMAASTAREVAKETRTLKDGCAHFGGEVDRLLLDLEELKRAYLIVEKQVMDVHDKWMSTRRVGSRTVYNNNVILQYVRLMSTLGDVQRSVVSVE